MNPYFTPDIQMLAKAAVNPALQPPSDSIIDLSKDRKTIISTLKNKGLHIPDHAFILLDYIQNSNEPFDKLYAVVNKTEVTALLNNNNNVSELHVYENAPHFFLHANKKGRELSLIKGPYVPIEDYLSVKVHDHALNLDLKNCTMQDNNLTTIDINDISRNESGISGAVTYGPRTSNITVRMHTATQDNKPFTFNMPASTAGWTTLGFPIQDQFNVDTATHTILRCGQENKIDLLPPNREPGSIAPQKKYDIALKIYAHTPNGIEVSENLPIYKNRQLAIPNIGSPQHTQIFSIVADQVRANAADHSSSKGRPR